MMRGIILTPHISSSGSLARFLCRFGGEAFSYNARSAIEWLQLTGGAFGLVA